MKLVAFCGKAGVGKTTATNHLVNSHGYASISFSYPIKQICNIIFGWDMDVLLAETPELRAIRDQLVSKEFSDEWTPRRAMQFIGTNLFRDQFDSDIWLLLARRKIQELLSAGNNVVVSDCRFPNEIKMIQELGGIVYVLWRKPSDLIKDETEHVSEIAWMEIESSLSKIDNTKTLEKLYDRLDKLK